MKPHTPDLNYGVAAVRLVLGEGVRGVSLIGETDRHTRRVLLMKRQLRLFKSVPNVLATLTSRRPEAEHNFEHMIEFHEALRRGEFEPPLSIYKYDLSHTQERIRKGNFDVPALQTIVNNLHMLWVILDTMKDRRADKIKVFDLTSESTDPLTLFAKMIVGLDEMSQDRASVRKGIKVINKFAQRDDAANRMVVLLQDVIHWTNERPM